MLAAIFSSKEGLRCFVGDRCNVSLRAMAGERCHLETCWAGLSDVLGLEGRIDRCKMTPAFLLGVEGVAVRMSGDECMDFGRRILC
jgi:hypothetical protein